MEFFGLLALAIVIGVPTIAIVALVRTKSAARRIEENWYKTSDLQSEIAGLRGDLARALDRVAKLEAAQSANAPVATPSAKTESYATQRVAAPVTAAPTSAADDSAHQSIAAPSWLDESAFGKAAAERAVPAAAAESHAQVRSAAGSSSAFEAPVRLDTAKEANATEAKTAAASPQTAPFAPPRPQTPPATISFGSAYQPRQPRESVFHRLRTNLPLEQFLGMNLFAKIGIVLLVLGFALLGRVALISMGPGARVALLYTVAGAMLGGGIWLEPRDRYRLVGRTGIGGGWALLFFTTYAMYHVAAMAVLRSNTFDCILLLAVAVAMVAHTLHYRSQLVTGLAFLLAFSTIALSQDSVYALTAGIILAIGIVAIGLRMSWFELEVFGILATYANHFYWLHKLYPGGVAGHAFPQFWPSVIILVLYWAVFRVSYVVRRIESPHQEALSTIAAIANTTLLLAVMKFQSTRPELAFYALLGLGALEFCFGQLPITRRRRAAFALLTVMGTLLIFAAIPFKFSGNNIALFWMIAAEALLTAGIVQKESLFRRLGLLAGLVTGALIVYEAWHIVAFRQTSETPLIKDGVLLLTCSLLFYLNAHLVARKWRQLFVGFESSLVVAQSYLGCVTAFLGIWAIFTSDWTAVAWAVLMIGAAAGARYLKSKHLLVQAWPLAAAVLIRAVVFNCHFDIIYPHHLVIRLVTLPLLAIGFYLGAWLLRGIVDLPLSLGSLMLWAGASLLATLGWLEIAPPWIAPVWVALAVALCLVGRRFKLHHLAWQEHALGVAAVVQLLSANLDAPTAFERYLPMLACAAAFYAISRFSTFKEATYRRPAAWLHTWTATALIAALAWHESPQPWLAAIWVLFALALALADRIFTIEELPWQAHLLAACAVTRAVTLNFFLTEKWHGVDLRLMTVSILIAALYAIARWVRLPEAIEKSDARHAYTWVATALTAWLLWCELEPVSVVLAWGLFGLLLFEVGTWRTQKQLRLQAYAHRVRRPMGQDPRCAGMRSCERSHFSVRKFASESFEVGVF